MPWAKTCALGSRPARAMERSRAADWLLALAAAKAGSLDSARLMASWSVIETGCGPGCEGAEFVIEVCAPQTGPARATKLTTVWSKNRRQFWSESYTPLISTTQDTMAG